MSTVIAIKYNHKLFMGCDGRTSDDNMITAENFAKVLVFKDYLLGFTGFSSITQTVELFHSETKVTDKNSLSQLKDALIELILSHGLKKQLKETSILFGTKEYLFIYDGCDDSFCECQYYASIGSGGTFVYGYFHAYKDFWGENWEKKISEIGGEKMISQGIHLAASCDVYSNKHTSIFSL